MLDYIYLQYLSFEWQIVVVWPGGILCQIASVLQMLAEGALIT